MLSEKLIQNIIIWCHIWFLDWSEARTKINLEIGLRVCLDCSLIVSFLISSSFNKTISHFSLNTSTMNSFTPEPNSLLLFSYTESQQKEVLKGGQRIINVETADFLAPERRWRRRQSGVSVLVSSPPPSLPSVPDLTQNRYEMWISWSCIRWRWHLFRFPGTVVA